MTIACQFSQLNIEFNQEALFPPLTHSLTCQRNALIGQNGKGKSVLLKLLAQKTIAFIRPYHVAYAFYSCRPAYSPNR
ncbi:ABC transporter, ATP-binding protein [Proteus mirabilis]|uniref:ABC transporter, ATP-binding protein n=1 Tax=Proteus mirabilis TaxID=584 RepID=A0A2X2BN77_PROMI|nr:ABC transporter, ATP-binding protein [Proteus mirabilis]